MLKLILILWSRRRLRALERDPSYCACFARMVIVVGFFTAAGTAAAASEERGGEFGGPTVDTLYDVQYLLNRAEQGDARAAFLLGTRFATGRGGARDDSEAFRWFRKASEAGLAEAQYNLGIMYATGRGVQRNMEEAARWYRAAADQGIAQAQFNIGTLYGLGLGVPRDEALAADWLEKAAEKGLPQAQYNLGVLYEHGRGVRLDAHTALDWYRRAADQGFPQARERYEELAARLEPPPSAQASAAPAAPAAVAQPARAARTGTPGPAAFGDWIANAEPSYYTLQLLSNTDEASVRSYVMRNIPPGEGDYFVTERDGQRWYSVVYGVYRNYAAAKQAAAALPSAFGKLKPWIRKIGSIQEQMIR